jgi:hypothetical protein
MKDQKKRKKQLSQLFYGQNPAGISGKVISNHAHSISQNPQHQHTMSVSNQSQLVSQYQNSSGSLKYTVLNKSTKKQ